MENSQEKRLIIETYLEDNDVIIRISDTGEGIAEEDLARIYSPNLLSTAFGPLPGSLPYSGAGRSLPLRAAPFSR